MSNFLITGVSSGIGKALTKQLISADHKVWGIARREKLLQKLKSEVDVPSRFFYSKIDLSQKGAWRNLISQMRATRFTPQIVIFNAAVFIKDYQQGKPNLRKARKSFEINFFSTLAGFNELLTQVKPRTQFIFINSSSALKGSGAEGVGYPASKAALSIAFESLYQKYKHRFYLQIIYFGPVDTTMSPTKSRIIAPLSPDRATNRIIKTVNSKQAVTYSPWYLFFLLRAIRLLPTNFYLTILSLIDRLHYKSLKK